ncbi:hypothetical protein HPC37_04400 [Pasteurellaceae bacterium 20609_3]|uniref:hypothetical protein n=1 Tax=Spirabiliibacterium mucosae TaxID=28156 RepID=UPI001AADCA42|nr:hypothetical protein [Spirabiliibacterium mucosae]MBE2898083.1 hypothetical protein [Spirabiliibacterium mucosae]
MEYIFLGFLLSLRVFGVMVAIFLLALSGLALGAMVPINYPVIKGLVVSTPVLLVMFWLLGAHFYSKWKLEKETVRHKWWEK